MPKNNLIKEILQFKIHKDIEFFKVRWEDNKETWTRSDNIADRYKICTFFVKIMKNLKEKREKIENERIDKRKKTLKEELLRMNTSKNDNEKTLNNQKTEKKNKNNKDLPFSNDFNKLNTSVNRNGKESNLKNTDYLKNKSVDAVLTGTQEFKIKKDLEILFSGQFYYSKLFPNLSFDIRTCTFLPIDRILPILHSLYYIRKELDLFLIDSLDSTILTKRNTQNNSPNFKEYMLNKQLACLCVDEENAWVLLTQGKNNLLQIPNGENYQMLFHTNNLSVLEGYSNIFNSVDKTNEWLDNSYKASFSYWTDYLFGKNPILSNSKHVGFFGDSDQTYSGKNIKNYLNKNTTLSEDFSNVSTLVVQNSFVKYIHQIDNFDKILTSNTKILVEEGLSFNEILRPRGIVIFLEDFIEYGPLDELKQLASIIKSKKNWKLTLAGYNYRKFKKRLSSLRNMRTAESNNYAELYNMLKNGYVETNLSELLFFDFVKRKNLVDFRHFIQVGFEATNVNEHNTQEVKEMINRL